MIKRKMIKVVFKGSPLRENVIVVSPSWFSHDHREYSAIKSEQLSWWSSWWMLNYKLRWNGVMAEIVDGCDGDGDEGDGISWQGN